jgi:voltage-gated potassium channel
MKPAVENELKREAQQLGFFEITVLFLSVYVLGAMLMQLLLPLPLEVHQLINNLDNVVCIVFLTDFFVRLRRAESRAAFMKWGWIDLLSSIPQVDALRWGRLARVIRIIRVLRAFGSAKRLIHFLYRRRSSGLAGTAVLVGTLLVIFSCIAILALEDEESSNIKTPFDALWWALSTITTVGYGDRYPVTVEGKLVAMVLMISGVSLFGVLTGLFARLFLEPDVRKEESEIRDLRDEVRQLREQIMLLLPVARVNASAGEGLPKEAELPAALE